MSYDLPKKIVKVLSYLSGLFSADVLFYCQYDESKTSSSKRESAKNPSYERNKMLFSTFLFLLEIVAAQDPIVQENFKEDSEILVDGELYYKDGNFAF